MTLPRINWVRGWTINGVCSLYNATVCERKVAVYRCPGGGWQGAVPSLGWYSPPLRNAASAKRWVRHALTRVD